MFSACSDDGDSINNHKPDSFTNSESYRESNISGDDKESERVSETPSGSESDEASESESGDTSESESKSESESESKSESGEESVHTHKFERNADERYLKFAATCEKRAEYYFSCECGEKSEETFEYGELSPHTVVIDEGIEATCTKSGRSGGKHCSVCNKILEEQQVIPALGHDTISHDGKAATCTEAGHEAYETCSRCDYTTYTAIPALGHDYVPHDGKAATCTEAGYKTYMTCTRCDYTTYEVIPALGHNLTHYNSKAATCTEAGYEAYDECSRCDYTTYKKIAALGHDLVIYEAKLPTCTEVGYDEYESCTRCDYTTYKEIAALGHNYNDGVCDNCDDILDTDMRYFAFTALSDGTYSVAINKANIPTLPRGIKIPFGYNGKRVVKIADRAFEDCKNLSMKIEMSEGIKEIGVSAFSGCSALTYIKISDSVTVIGNSAFYQCSGLKNVILPESLDKIGVAAFAHCEGLTSLVIPASLKKVEEQTFSYCSNLVAVTISDGVKEIDNKAFANCIKLRDINIPSSVEYVDSDIFENSNNIKYNAYDNAYYIGNHLNKYVYLVKAKDRSISTCMISEQTKFIGNNAFENCLNLVEIMIPDSVLIINDKAFNGCGELRKISMGKNIQIVGTAVFDNCDNKLFEKEDNVIYVANWAVKPIATGITSVSLRIGTRGVARRAFSGCEKLKSIAIPNSVVTIGYGAFSGCAIRSVNIPYGVVRVENYAFAASVYSADAPLYSVSIADSVEYIGDGAFNGKYLRYFSLGKNVKYLGSCIINSYNLETITYSGTVESWKKIEKASDWSGRTERYTVKCVDGNI